jgi:hypothetical protein
MRATRIAQLAELKERVGHGGASQRAAEYILHVLEARHPAALRSHFAVAESAGHLTRDAA